jgi:hypothetical protein
MKWSELSPEQRNALVAESVMGIQRSDADPLCQVYMPGREMLVSPVLSEENGYREFKASCMRCGWSTTLHIHPHNADKSPLEMMTRHSPAIPHYSESMDAAWQIVKHLDDSLEVNKTGKLCCWQFLGDIATSYDAYSDHYGSDEAIFSLGDLAALTPEKICIAALRACGIEVEL